jgi:hypothetical protein
MKIIAIIIIIIIIIQKSDTSNNRSKWNHLKTIQKIKQKHNWKAVNQGTTEKKPYWAMRTYWRKYCLKVQKVYHGKEDYIAH